MKQYRINELMLYREYEQEEDQILQNLERSSTVWKKRKIWHTWMKKNAGNCIFPACTDWWRWQELTDFPEICGTAI